MSGFANRVGRYFVRTFAGVGVLTVGGIAASQYVILKEKKKSEDIPSNVVLHLDMNVPLTETNPKPFEGLFNPQPPIKIHNVIKALDHAATDKRVAGVVCTFGGEVNVMNMAMWQEVRNSILKFRETQKDEPEGSKRFTWASADTFGEAGDGTVGYYFASAFDKVYMQPSGLLGLMGVHSPVLFFKRLLTRIGIEPQVFNYYEYKNATNPLTQEGFTAAHREQMSKLLGSLFEQLVDGVAQGRSLDTDTVKTLFNRGSMTAEEAKDAKLIDTVLYPDQVLSHVAEGTKVLPLRKYIKSLESQEKKKEPSAMMKKDDKPKIALITMVGPIVRGWGDPNSRSSQICSEKTMREIRTAYQDKTVKAIVVRVDSRGGSAVASDSIRRELERAKEAGLPIVVSMGNFAASGGYYIATAADKIVCQPATITGSIGVIFGKFVIGRALEQVGVTNDGISHGDFADSMSPYTPWTKEQADVAERMGRKCYTDFTKLVMDARKLSADQVDKLARGRVWAGSDAKRLGLADELGGLQDAHVLAGKLCGLEGKELPKLVDFPKAKNPVEKLAAVLSGDSPDAVTTSVLEGTGAGEVMEFLRVVISAGEAVKQAGLTGQASTGIQMEAEDLGR
mmetsp:Transcript_6808/g.15998  ORF Transcript_6808/g.15998 Transcript_6808/m.15998 type:complete len:621 (+) Transcript_6808:65-1927(+)